MTRYVGSYRAASNEQHYKLLRDPLTHDQQLLIESYYILYSIAIT